MSPEALIGVELGKGVLQRQLGHGTIGAVYLSDQLQRQVAVKVFLSASLLKDADQAIFLKRLQEEIALSASLDHPHILPILEHGEQDDLVYQITPYVVGGTLQERIDRFGALPFTEVQKYLEALALALDYAHGRSILHRDVKPGNILFAADGSLLLADFAVASVTTEKNFARVRRVTSGMLNYIAPEYVMGKQIDQRADLYSLGAVLYHMVTGEPPFTGASLGEVATKHVKAAPRPPDLLRLDLPQAASQVLLRALAKRPAERYTCAQDLATAFRQSLEAAQLLSTEKQPTNALALLADLANSSTKPMLRLSSSRGGSLFDPKWQPSAEKEQSGFFAERIALPEPTVLPEQVAFSGPVSPLLPADQEVSKSGFLSGAHLQPGTSDQSLVQPQKPFTSHRDLTASFATSSQEKQEVASDSVLDLANKPVGNTEELRFSSLPPPQITSMLGALAKTPMRGEGTGTIKLTEPVKIVQVPVVGQPGQFVTGFLPIQPPVLEETHKRSLNLKQIVGVFLALLIIATGSGIFWATHNSHGTVSVSPRVQATPDLSASATAAITATVAANTILSDNLSQNVHDWPVGKQGDFNYAFAGGAYNITNNDAAKSAPALLPDKVITGPFVYNLTMEQIKGNEASPNNQFGMILYANIQNGKNKQTAKFYAFEVLNGPGGDYQFWKYDNSKSGASPWNMLWSKKFGSEFHRGSGPAHVNAFRVIATGKSFTFLVNGHKVGTWKDGSFSSGSIGMLVNLQGAEVAFSNLLLTYA
jgi:serine/threonine protein kinase